MTERGPLNEFAITYTNGQTERVVAHQVSYGGSQGFFGGDSGPARIRFHAEIDGQWTMILDVLESDVRVVRNLTQVPTI